MTQIDEIDLTPPKQTAPTFRRWILENFIRIQEFFDTGYTGTFTEHTGKTVTVVKGIITGVA